MKRKKSICLVLAASLFINIFCGLYFFLKFVGEFSSVKNAEIVLDNPKYVARLSTFQLNNESTQVVFVGDSITAYIDWHEFFPEEELLNRGIEGDTWGGVLHRLDEVISRNPSTIIFMVGINDIAQKIQPAEILRNIDIVCERIKENLPEARVLIFSILPSPNISIDKVKEVNERIEQLSKERKNVEYCDIFPEFILEDGSPNMELFSEDGIHLNGNGYRIWIDRLKTIL
ncbi:GDSL-type esterase/lipase family protein [Eubacterium limosum]|jgi:hypothetical protein|nr:GDSL-type esterase/lipase family protein [Eubacterium limosum]UQZ20730.1 GDSL-type esterase/lipase family protein [Eubacterium limosum]